MTRRIFRTLAVAGAANLIVLATALPAQTAAQTAAHVGESQGWAACFDPVGSGAAARGDANARADDHRAVSRTEQEQIAARTAQILKARPTPGNSLGDIPVYVHVMIGKGGVGDVTDAQIAAQMDVANQTFGGSDPDGRGVRTGVRFQLAGTERIVNNNWHNDRQSTTYRAQTRQGGKNALNIWIVGFRYLGVATFPWDYASQPEIDGIRVNFDSLPGGSITNYNLGKTMTHETGHWLGLWHTFQGGCNEPNDEVADTPAQASPTTGCPEGRDSCANPGLDPIHNYMDYSYDGCYYTFTSGQAARIDAMWTAYRA